MPLDNRKLTAEIVSVLRDLPYEEKIRIYESKCKNCGYSRIVVNGHVVRSLQEAIDIGQAVPVEIEYSCEYPGDILEKQDGTKRYPTLTEIISNTCTFWDMPFVEVHDVKESSQ